MKINAEEKCQIISIYVCDKCKKEISLKEEDICPMCPKCGNKHFYLKE